MTATATATRAAMVAVLALLWTPSRADTEVVCVFMETCVLPCSFGSSPDAAIRWTLMKPRDSSVHAYYFGADQTALQDRRFEGRTSLFRDQISRGNASLRLTRVQVQDEGRYKCYVDTSQRNQDSFVDLRVDAPVQAVDLQQEGERLTCSSHGIYPEPRLAWTSSPSPSRGLQSATIVRRGPRQLYNISSTLTPSHDGARRDYTCTVSTRANSKTEVLLSRAKARIAIAQVVGVVLVAVLMSLVPCFYKKCKKSQGTMRTNCSSTATIV